MEHDTLAKQRIEKSLERQEQKHARQVVMELDKERIKLEGKYRTQTNQARQMSSKLKTVLEEQKELREQFQRAENDKNAMVRKFWRKRKDDAVKHQTL